MKKIINKFRQRFLEKKIQESSDYFFLILPIFLVLFPFLLILTQPDLGTAMLLLFISLVIFFISGLNWKFFAFFGIGGLTITPYLWTGLKEYQKQRILTLFNPENDPLGSGYQIIQSQIAVGSGGTLGKGWTKGTQSHLDFLPEKHTDFIFSMLGEEFGFIGSVGLLILYSIIIFRIIRIGSISRSNFAKLFCFGYAFAIFIYIVVNLSMVLGLLPIVGSPLPIMSYGGSSMLATMIGFGIVLSAKINHKQMIA